MKLKTVSATNVRLKLQDERLTGIHERKGNPFMPIEGWGASLALAPPFKIERC